MEALSRLPLELVENCGQWPAETRFGARKDGASVAIELEAIVFQQTVPEIGSATLALRFEGVSDSVSLRGGHPLPGKHNYLYGTDPKGWTTDVPTYASVEYQSLYEGIDLHVYEGGRLIEYDVVCETGRRLPSFSVLCEEADELVIDEEGRLIARAGEWDLVQEPPVAWYLRPDGGRRPVESWFELRGDQRFGLAVGEVLDLPLIVDPKVAFRVLAWSTHLGGYGEDVAWDVAVSQYGQSMGQVFVVGETWSTNFPTTTGAYQTQKGGTFDQPDVFVTRLNAQASAYVFSTYIGTSCPELGYALDLADDGNGNDIVPVFTGYFTNMGPDDGNLCAYPTTTNAFDTNANKGAPGGQPQNDAFVTVLDSTGASLIYSSYLGSDQNDEGRAIAVVPNPVTEGIEFVVGGWTEGGITITYPVQGGAGGGTAFQTSFQGGATDGFLAHITTEPVSIPPGGLMTTLLYSTYLGGTVGDEQVLDLETNTDPNLTDVEVVAVGSTSSTDYPLQGNPLQPSYGGGSLDGFVSRLRMAGSGSNDLRQSTYLGGADDDQCWGIVLTGVGDDQEVTTCGQTFSSQATFPMSGGFDTTYNGNGDGFVTRLDESLSTLVWSTYLGGSQIDEALDISIVPGTTATPVNVCGRTQSGDFPVWPTNPPPSNNRAFDITYNGDWDAFVTRISQTGGLGCSTYLGDDADEGGDDIAWGISPDGRDQVIVVGQTASFNFPVTGGVVQPSHGGGSSDGFVTKFRIGNPMGQ